MKISALDLSKPIHPRALELFAPLIPGLFFEISLFLGDRSIDTFLKQSSLYEFGYYSRVAMGLGFGYLVGLTALMLKSILQDTIRYLFWRRFQSKNAPEQPSGAAPTDNPQELKTRGKRIQLAIRQEGRRRGAGLVWLTVARALLKDRYGIEATDAMFSAEEQETWYVLIGVPTNEQLRGSMLVRGVAAAGWLGILAAAITPHLRHWQYILFSLILLAPGLYWDIRQARWLSNPANERITKTAWMMNEISQASAKKADARGGEEEDQRA